MLGIETLLVEAMTELVQDAEEAVAEVLGVKARGDAAIKRADCGKERMRGRVEPAALKIESERRGYLLAERALPVNRIFTMDNCRIGLPAGIADDSNQRDQLAAENLKQPGELPGRGARFVFLEQGVIEAARVARGGR